MAYSSQLVNLPSELLEQVISCLDLDSIKNVRRVCSNLSTRCLGPSFKAYIKPKHIDLSRGNLESLVTIASHIGLCPIVENLFITTSIYDTSGLEKIVYYRERQFKRRNGTIYTSLVPPLTEEELQKARSDLDWMRARIKEARPQAEEETASHLATILGYISKFDTISVSLSVIQGPEKLVQSEEAGQWHQTFLRASCAFRIVTRAIAQSKVQVKKLYIFRNHSKCSIPAFDITQHVPEIEHAGFATPGEHIESFALTMSTRIRTNYSTVGILRADDLEFNAERNFLGIARLLKNMPNLRTLDLHMYRTCKSGWIRSYSKIFKHIAEEIYLPNLTQLFLGGLPMSELSFQKFLHKNSNLQNIKLSYVRLTKGSWSRILANLVEYPALEVLQIGSVYNAEEDGFDLLPRQLANGTMLQQENKITLLINALEINISKFREEQLDVLEALEFKKQPQQDPPGPFTEVFIDLEQARYGPPE